MRNAQRSKQQLEKTSANRARVFEFMQRFNAKHNWSLNGPIGTDIDEIMCFSWEGGVVLIQTWEFAGGWSIYTQPTKSSDLDTTEFAMLQQLEEDVPFPAADHDPGIRIPVEGMTPNGFPEPRPAVGELASLTPEQMFPKSLASLREAMYMFPADAPIHFSKKAVVDIAEHIGLEQMTDDNIRSFINKAESILTTRHQSDANS